MSLPDTPDPLRIEARSGNICKVTFKRTGQSIAAEATWKTKATPEEYEAVNAVVRKYLRPWMAPWAAPMTTEYAKDLESQKTSTARFLASDTN
jgi:hypothetical protein